MLADKKPLPAFEGQAEGTPEQVLQKLSALRLPDDESRRDALTCLREAAYRLPANVDVLREAIATEIQLVPLQWSYIHAFATTLGELDPNDDRALYLLARLEYEQPVAIKAEAGSMTMPMSAAKRSKDRMMKGIELVTRLKARETPIRARTAYLEAQMNAWLMQYYRQPGQQKPDAEVEAGNRLRAILFDTETGMIITTLKQDNLGIISHLDLQGLYGLNQMAIELVIEDCRRAGKPGDVSVMQPPWLEQLLRMMDAAAALAKKSKSNGRSTEAADFFVQACLKTMPFLAPQRPEIWAGYRDQVIELAKDARSENRLGQALPLRMADLLTREGQWLEQRHSPDTAKIRYQEAIQWIDEGLKTASEIKAVTPMTLTLHEAKLRLLVNQQAPLGTCQPHLELLKNSKHDSATAAAAYYQGIMAEREGRLHFAQGQLEKASRSGRNDLNRRALTLLIPVYLTLEMPDQALTAIKDLTRLLGRLDGLSSSEQSWIYGMIQSPDELIVQKVQAHLLAANQVQQLLKAETASSKQQRTMLAQHESQVKQLIEKGSANPAISGRMQLAWAQYLMQWDRLKEAEPYIASLTSTHGDWLETLRLQIGFALVQGQTPSGNVDAPIPQDIVQKVDQLIQQYLTKTQAHPGGKLIWLKWLATTGRADIMQKLINDQVFLGDASHDVVAKRLRALAHLYVGNREQSNELLKTLPADPQIELALLQTAHSLSEQQQILASSVELQQDASLFRTWSAAIALAKGDHAEACRQFVNCLEYSRVRPLVRQGLTESLIAWSQYQPLEARKMAAEALQQYSSDPSLLLGYAYASLKLGELGNPTDAGDQVKDMATALKAFEAACQQEHRDPAYAAWAQTQCWLQSPRRDVALMYAMHTLECNSKHEGGYGLAIQLLLEQNESNYLVQAQKLAATYRANLPLSTEALYWQARCFDRGGRPNEALALYRELMEKVPRHQGVYPATCQLLLNAPTVESLAACHQVINRWKAALPEDARSTQVEVQLYASQDKLAACRTVVDRAMNNVETRVLGDAVIQTVSTEQQQQQQLVVKKADMLCLLSQSMLQSKQFGEAAAWLKRAMELCPDHEGAQLLIGQLLIEQMRGQPARSEARRTLAQQAATVFSKIYRRQQGQLLSGNNLAWLLASELNDPTEAYRIMQEVRTPKYYTRPMTGDMLPVAVLDTLGLVYNKLDRPEQLQERIAVFEAARRRYAEEPRIALYLAQGYLAAGDGKRAMTTYQAARNLLPKSTLTADVQRVMNQDIQHGMVEAQEKSR